MRAKKMKALSTQEANAYLAHIGMRIGDWNQIADIGGPQASESSWVNYPAPENSNELLSFSQHAAGWPPKGEWKMLQIDNSTCLDAVQENFIGRLLFGPEYVGRLNDSRNFLFEFGKSWTDDRNTELLISDLVFSFLLFEAHGYFVSSNSNDGARLGIQDGFAYFSARDKDIHGTNTLLENFARNPLMSPRWIIEIIAE
jgi:hypothetical protein